MIGVGAFVVKKVTTMVDYLVAGRKISPYLGVASLGGTELGLITVMYNAQKGFSAGLKCLAHGNHCWGSYIFGWKNRVYCGAPSSLKGVNHSRVL